MMKNTHKVALSSFLLLISLHQVFASASIATNASPNPNPTWDDVVDVISSGIYSTVKDMLKSYEDIHKCGPHGNNNLPTPTPPSSAPTPLFPSPPTTPRPSSSPAPPPSHHLAPSPSPSSNADSPPPPPSLPSPSPSPKNGDSPPPPSLTSPTPSPQNGDSSPPPPPSSGNGPIVDAGPIIYNGEPPKCQVISRCQSQCDGVNYRSYSCDRTKPCWSYCYNN